MQSNSHLLNTFKSISRISAIIVISIGGIVLFGWAFNIAVFKSISPNLPMMMSNTAICFILSGISLLLLQEKSSLSLQGEALPPVIARTLNEEKRTKQSNNGFATLPSAARTDKRKLVAKFCSIIVLLIGTLTLIEYIFKMNLGIDGLIFKDTETPEISYAGRMSPQNAINFTLLGISLLLLDFKIKGFYPAHFFSAFISLFSISSIIGYTYGIPALYSISYYTGMALHSAAGFLIISLGIFSARPDYGIMSIISSDSSGGYISRRLIPVSIILPYVLGLLRLQSQRAGLFHNTEFGVFLLVFSNIIIFAALIVWYAKRLYISDAERMKADESLHNANRTLKMLTECNMALVKAVDEQELLKNICNLAVKDGGYSLAWIGYAAFDKNKSVSPIAWAGHGEDYVKTADITWADTEKGRGPTGTAIRTAKPSLCRDILNNPNFAPWRYNAIIYGYASSIALPLNVVSCEQPIGALNIYSDKPDDFDDEEVKLLMELADDLSYGIIWLRGRIEKQRLDRENELLKTIAMEIIKATDMHSAIQIVLNKVCKSTGWVYGESWIPNKDKNALEPGIAFAMDIGHSKFTEHSKGFVFKAGIGLPGRVWSSKKPEWIRDVSVNGHVFLRSETAMAAGLRAAFGVPIVADNEVLAVLIFYMPKASIEDESQIKLISAAVSQLGSIIQRKKAEEDKAKLESQIRHMQKIETIGQLTGGIAHDFNNLLTAIILSGNILKRKVENNPESLQFVQQILSIADRAANLTKSLLTFSRKQVIDKKAVSLNSIIQNAEKLLTRIIGEDIELKINLSEEDIVLMADSGQIEQVLLNLSTNARDAMAEGGSLTIDTKAVDIDESFAKTHAFSKTGLHAMITISDSGAGMDETTMEKIFEPFFTTKGAGKGTGLGLSIVYGIIKAHDGYINVYSEAGKGTTFKIYLPIVQSEVEGAKEQELIPPKRGTETILLAEDEFRVRDLTKNLLEGYGYKVIEAVDGEDAIKKFNENRDSIQFLITDVVMPKRNGKEVYNEIKKARPDMKALFVSGYNEEVIHKKGILEEGLNFISKPFAPTEFLRKVRDVLDKM